MESKAKAILTLINVTVAVIAILAVACIDTEGWFFTIVLAVCLGWFGLEMLVKDMFYLGEDDE